MKGQIVMQHLDGAAPVDFFVEELEFGGASAAGSRSQLDKGTFSAVVPAGTTEERILQFGIGGLLPAEPKRLLGDKWVQQTPTTVPTLAKIVVAMVSWHFLAFVTDSLYKARSVQDLLGEARMILAGAYDGESALIWERRP